MNARPPRFSARRTGFVLPIVMWVTVAIGAIAGAALLVARQEVTASLNRMELTDSGWRAEGCAEVVIAELEVALFRDVPDTPTLLARWNDLSALIQSPVGSSGCVVRLRAVGMTRNVNDATEEQLRHLFRLAGMKADSAALVSASIMDWKDQDTIPRPLGAESGWYRDRLLAQPRNAPFRASAELLLVRGAKQVGGIDTLLGVDASKLVWPLAPLAVLASLPGMSEEALRAIADSRGSGVPISDVHALAQALGGEAKDGLEANLSKLLELTTSTVPLWHMYVLARGRTTPVTASLDVRLALGDHRLAILQRTPQP